LTNIVMVGALLAQQPVLPIDAIENALRDHLPERHKKLLPLNYQALRAGEEFVKKELMGENI
jgi:2-oxoglutarate ferredoxin oxidoreductase subunit gamma